MKTTARLWAMLGALAVAGGLAGQVHAQRYDERERDRGGWDRGERPSDRGGWDRRGYDGRQGEQDWVLLGEQEVGFRVDRDVIEINHGEEWHRTRSFRTLQFRSAGNDIHMISIRLVYINGYAEDLRVDQVIHEGDALPLSLRGERKYLRRIEMTYRSRPDYRGRAVVQVWGSSRRFGGSPQPSPPPGAAFIPGAPGGSPRDDHRESRRPSWIELGCHQVALIGRDQDTIPVGHQEGRFKAIRLSVRGADVEVRELRVIYADGEPDDLAVRALIRAGEYTRPLDLQGWERAIDRVEMTFRTRLDPLDIVIKQRISAATVCVEGLQ